MYTPGLGRFGRRDPTSYNVSLDGNLYEYVSCRPTSMIDPLGLQQTGTWSLFADDGLLTEQKRFTLTCECVEVEVDVGVDASPGTNLADWKHAGSSIGTAVSFQVTFTNKTLNGVPPCCDTTQGWTQVYRDVTKNKPWKPDGAKVPGPPNGPVLYTPGSVTPPDSNNTVLDDFPDLWEPLNWTPAHKRLDFLSKYMGWGAPGTLPTEWHGLAVIKWSSDMEIWLGRAPGSILAMVHGSVRTTGTAKCVR
jgi:hypothetical protein